MGALAALKARTVAAHTARVLATELACACQGLEFHRPLRTTPLLEEAVRAVREQVPRVERDRSLAGELDRLGMALRTGELVLAADEARA
jgi:histidine ammonia-lyase